MANSGLLRTMAEWAHRRRWQWAYDLGRWWLLKCIRPSQAPVNGVQRCLQAGALAVRRVVTVILNFGVAVVFGQAELDVTLAGGHEVPIGRQGDATPGKQFEGLFEVAFELGRDRLVIRGGFLFAPADNAGSASPFAGANGGSAFSAARDPSAGGSARGPRRRGIRLPSHAPAPGAAFQSTPSTTSPSIAAMIAVNCPSVITSVAPPISA